ncbi:anti-anti-sigma factor [Oceanospirillum multiglobuliferum]|uniref:Anti-sigma factor antagonist n=1 Tax=Oceanospirillum multiglobuliferum TaxID=64969 RepID=A0A1T4RXK0_9GAMM|nr:STAS domain-containing protein [Oceanospirillum multiglobuliferum]OPX54597.1 anti-sigma-factor [Oceanospirillum multiglobuliferum]SKA20683.1 anti-anti-sigma factor [Oceanospirillum multiglobuliferum]
MYQSHYTLNEYEVLEISGELDCVAVAERKDLLEKIPTQFSGHILCDLSKVTFMDSSGIGALVFLFKRLREQNRKLVLVGLTGQPKELTTLLRINRAIPVHADIRSCVTETLVS